MKKINKSELTFNGISSDLIRNAVIEIEAESIINEADLRNPETQKLCNKASFSFFIENHKQYLSVYKQEKNSGYNLILLYKGVVMVGSADFMTTMAKEMKVFPVSKSWPVYQCSKLKKQLLCNIFTNPFDKRTKNDYKPTAERMWEVLQEVLFYGFKINK